MADSCSDAAVAAVAAVVSLAAAASEDRRSASTVRRRRSASSASRAWCARRSDASRSPSARIDASARASSAVAAASAPSISARACWPARSGGGSGRARTRRAAAMRCSEASRSSMARPSSRSRLASTSVIRSIVRRMSVTEMRAASTARRAPRVASAPLAQAAGEDRHRVLGGGQVAHRRVDLCSRRGQPPMGQGRFASRRGPSRAAGRQQAIGQLAGRIAARDLLLGLRRQATRLRPELAQDVPDPSQVRLGFHQPLLGLPPSTFVASHAGRLLEQWPAFLGAQRRALDRPCPGR